MSLESLRRDAMDALTGARQPMERWTDPRWPTVSAVCYVQEAITKLDDLDLEQVALFREARQNSDDIFEKPLAEAIERSLDALSRIDERATEVGRDDAARYRADSQTARALIRKAVYKLRLMRSGPVVRLLLSSWIPALLLLVGIFGGVAFYLLRTGSQSDSTSAAAALAKVPGRIAEAAKDQPSWPAALAAGAKELTDMFSSVSALLSALGALLITLQKAAIAVLRRR